MATIAPGLAERDAVEVEPENLPAVTVFFGCVTQWRKEFAGMEGKLVYHGLIYPAVESVIRMYGHRGKKARGVFADVQIMEAAALPILNRHLT